jgi:choline dehydrogenase-like flavoprotein
VIGRLGSAPDLLRADVLVVGAGAAGLTVARELGRAGRDVLVAESGGLDPDAASAALNAAETSGAAHLGVEIGRARALGGTTRLWPGQLLRLRPVDFERREWLRGSGWPISAGDLEGPYARAEAMLGVEGPLEAPAVWRDWRLQAAPLRGSGLEAVASAYSPTPDLGKLMRRELQGSGRVRVLLDATVLRLDLSADGSRVQRAELGSLGGARAAVEPREVVLAAGGIENARLLLLSEVPNASVGRYFHDHPVAESAAVLRATSPRPLQDWFGLFFRRGRKAHAKLALTAEAQESLRVAACSATFVFRAPPRSGAEAALRLRRRALRREPLRGTGGDLTQALADLPALVSGLHRRYLRGLAPAPAPAGIELLCIAEQAPDCESRIELGTSLDPFGLPRARLHWSIGDPEREAIAATVDTVGRWLESAGLGSLEPAAWLREDGWRAQLHDGFHHMGATRMSDDPAAGVVDRNCRVHGVRNLYVAGSSVFPTAGYANPTLTIVALAIRLADHLRADA